MSVASFQQSFLANALIPQTHKPKTKFFTSPNTISCKRSSSSDDDHQKGYSRYLYTKIGSFNELGFCFSSLILVLITVWFDIILCYVVMNFPERMRTNLQSWQWWHWQLGCWLWALFMMLQLPRLGVELVARRSGLRLLGLPPPGSIIIQGN